MRVIDFENLMVIDLNADDLTSPDFIIAAKGLDGTPKEYTLLLKEKILVSVDRAYFDTEDQPDPNNPSLPPGATNL